MPTKNENNGQIFLKTKNEEWKALGKAIDLEAGMYIDSEWSLIPMKKLFCNNWRKMHHLPLIRRKGKRK